MNGYTPCVFVAMSSLSPPLRYGPLTRIRETFLCTILAPAQSAGVRVIIPKWHPLVVGEHHVSNPAEINYITSPLQIEKETIEVIHNKADGRYRSIPEKSNGTHRGISQNAKG